MEDSSSINFFNYLSTDITQLVLSKLPIKSIVRCSAVCKLFRSVITSNSFPATAILAATTPWFFFYRRDGFFANNNQLFGYDPLSNEWIKFPITHIPTTLLPGSSFTGADGYFFHHTAKNISFSPILKLLWKETKPLNFSRRDALVGVMKHGFCSESKNVSGFQRDLDLVLNFPRFIVVGSSTGQNNLVVELYNGTSNSWQICSPLPAEFELGISMQSYMSVSYKSRYYVYCIYTGFVSYIDLNSKVWSDVQTLKPPGVIRSCLIASVCGLMLAGLFKHQGGRRSFNLWRIDEFTLEVSEFATMPRDMLSWLLGSVGDSVYDIIHIIIATLLVFVKLCLNRMSVDG